MYIKLYKNSSEANRIGKTLTNETEFTECQLKDATSVLKPTVLLTTENPAQFNYMYIYQFHRYYFITDIVSVRNGLWSITGEVDVLESYKSDIKALHVILSDSGTNGASDYITGDQWKSKVKAKTDIINFSSGLNNSGEYILITAGG